MGVKERLQRLERRTGGRKPPRLVVAIEQPEGGTYQGSDGRTYTGPELDGLAAEGVRVVKVERRREPEA